MLEGIVMVMSGDRNPSSFVLDEMMRGNYQPYIDKLKEEVRHWLDALMDHAMAANGNRKKFLDDKRFLYDSIYRIGKYTASATLLAVVPTLNESDKQFLLALFARLVDVLKPGKDQGIAVFDFANIHAAQLQIELLMPGMTAPGTSPSKQAAALGDIVEKFADPSVPIEVICQASGCDRLVDGHCPDPACMGNAKAGRDELFRKLRKKKR